MEYKAFLIKYGEIGLKGKNRHVFENILCEQIKKHLTPFGEFSVVREQGRIFVSCPECYDYDGTVEELQKVFGITAICPVVVVDSTDWEEICAEAVRYVERCYGNRAFTFKVEAKRADKRYPITSPEMCARLGEVLLAHFPALTVDVRDPEVRITVEVRGKSYVYSHVIAGAGGMPVGSGGKAMLLLSGGIDSPVAGYMVAKRGVELEATYFHAPPYTSERAKQKVVDLARTISAYTGPIRLYVVNFTELQLYLYEQCPHEQLTILMRRFMMRIAETLAKRGGCLGLVTGESIGQVASQTMQSLMATDAVCELPVYRPLIAFDKQEIVEVAERIRTYETSIQPYEDCCTIFVAKHPVTKPVLSAIEKSEERLEGKIGNLVKEALDTVEVIRIGE